MSFQIIMINLIYAYLFLLIYGPLIICISNYKYLTFTPFKLVQSKRYCDKNKYIQFDVKSSTSPIISLSAYLVLNSYKVR